MGLGLELTFNCTLSIKKMIKTKKIINIMIKLQRKGFGYKNIFEDYTILSSYLNIILLNLNKFLSLYKSVCTSSHPLVFSISNLNKSGRKFELGH